MAQGDLDRGAGRSGVGVLARGVRERIGGRGGEQEGERRDLEAVVDVRANDFEAFRIAALTCPEVTWLAYVTGRNDFQVHVACAGTAGLNALLKRFTREFGALDTVTTVVLERSR